MPFKSILDSQLNLAVKPDNKSWFGRILDNLSLTDTYTKASKKLFLKHSSTSSTNV